MSGLDDILLDREGTGGAELPLVCICVPTYNSASTVGESLGSILKQTYKNLTIHISDNASSDDTLKVIQSMADDRVAIHRHEVNSGAEKNFTRCIQLATGKYTAIFHADDIYEGNIVAKQVEFLESNPEVGAVFTQATMINELGVPIGITGAVPGIKRGVARLGFTELLRIMLLHHNFLVCPSVMVRTEIYKNEIGEWGSSLFRSASDIDTWLRLASKRPIAILDERLMRYRFSAAQFSYKNRNRTERLDFFLVMDDYLARPEVRSVITKNDLRHYGWLERHERVARAMILFGLARVKESKDLLDGILCWDAFCAALGTRRGFVTLAGFALLRVLMPFGASRSAIAIVKAAKNISWR